MIQFCVDAMELDIPTKQKFLLVCLADNADMYGVCYPSMATLARKTSMPERTLQRQMQWLIKHNIVEVFWDFTDKIRHRKIQHYRLKLASATKSKQPDFSNCSKELRSEVINRFQSTCAYCSQRGDSLNGPDGAPWQIDRIIPGSKGGSYVADNVTLACRACNASKGAKSAPIEVLSLGAILDEQGCQSGESVVPNQQSVVPSNGTRTIIEPPEEEKRTVTPVNGNGFDVQKAFEYFCQSSGKTKAYVLTDKRKDMALRRWKEVLKIVAGDVHEAKVLVKKAMDGVLQSEFMQEKGFVEWEQVFRSEENFSKWVERWESMPQPKRS